jgi:hypothetical protein
VKRTLTPPFRSGPWTGSTTADDVDGVRVVERLATRDDAPGALVRLENGRLAVLGDVLAVGHPLLMRLFAQRRADGARSTGDRAWWSEVRRELALLTPAGLLDGAGPRMAA